MLTRVTRGTMTFMFKAFEEFFSREDADGNIQLTKTEPVRDSETGVRRSGGAVQVEHICYNNPRR